jgi:hypothetical protein
MKVRPYEEKDFAQLREWGEEWGETYNEDQFPKVGFIVDGVAAYFLYQTDSCVCWLECLISKKDADKMAKARALDLLVDAILKEATELGYTVAYATTDNLSVAKRARQNGAAIKINQFLLIKDLTQPAHLQ